MAQVFHPIANAIARLSLVLLLAGVAGTLVVLDLLHRSPYATEVDVARQQPVPFSHKHHANMGIDCRYCHTSVEESNSAGLPPTRTCMNCHSMVWNEAPMLEPVRESWKTGKSLEWIRVHDLPQFVYFNHSIHIAKGVGCSTCHGRVDQMPLMRKQNTLYMGWCLQCHLEPEKYVRPKDEIFNMAYRPPTDQAALGAKLVKEYKIDAEQYRMANCYYCHR
jgi:ferredoxin